MPELNLNLMLKAAALAIALFAATEQLPAGEAPAPAVEERSEAAMQRSFAENSVASYAKGSELKGRPLTQEQRKKIYRTAYDAAAEFIALAKKNGLFDEYRAAQFDSDLCKLNEQALKATNFQEIMSLTRKRQAVFREKHPKIWHWMDTDPELRDAVMRMFMKFIEILEK